MADFNDGDVVRLGCVQEIDLTDDLVNVLHVTINSGGPMAFAAASQDFQEYCDALYNPLVTSVSSRVTSKHISVKNVTQAQVWGNIAWLTYGGGSSGSDAVANQLAVLVWGRTTRPRVQIRKYLGLFTEINITNGLWISALQALCGAFMVYHIAPQTMTNGLVLQGCAYNYALSRVTLANSYAVSANPVVQRRRRKGRGG